MKYLQLEKYYLVAFFFLTVIVNFYCITLGFDNNLIEIHKFRQTQTAISIYYFLKEGFTLDYITPVLGAPWSIPFEFPTYQLIVGSLVKVTGMDIAHSGRIVSILFFYIALVFIYKFMVELGYEKLYSLIPVSLILICPQYIYWSRAFMIESTALCLCVIHFYYLFKYARNENFKIFVSALVFGVLAALTKITTYCTCAVPFALYFTLLLISEIKKGNIRYGYWTHILVVVLIPLVSSILWNKHVDSLRALNPWSETSSELFKWNFGTLAQRSSIEVWYRIGQRFKEYAFGHEINLVVLLPLLAASLRSKSIATLCILGSLGGPLLFINLYWVHDYYLYAVFFLVLIAMGISLIFLAAHPQKIIRYIALGLIMPAVCFIMLRSYLDSGYHRFQKTSRSIPQESIMLSAFTKPDDVVFIYGQDWDPSIPYYAKRKAVMNRFDLPFEHKTVKKSLSNTGYDRIASIIHPNMPKGLLGKAEEVFGKKFVKMGGNLYLCEERAKNIKLHDYGNIINASAILEALPKNQTEILTGGNGLSVKNKRNAAFYFLPNVKLRHGFYKLIKVRMTSPQKNVFQIYYRTKNTPDYIEKNSFKYMLAKGENRFMMALPADSVGNIRIEVGSTPGNYIIEELSIGELPETHPHDSIEL